MMSLATGDIVRVPYPYVENNRLRARPALIIAAGMGEGAALCRALMITNAARPEWPGDVVIADHVAAGLPIASKVRTEKIATLEMARATRIGQLPPRQMIDVVRAVLEHLAIADHS